MRKKLIYRALALVLILFIVFATPLSQFFVPKARAGTFSPRKVTISDSRAGATGASVVYDFAFTTTVTTSIKQIDFKFCTQAGLFADTCTAPTGFVATSGVRGSDNIAGVGRVDSSPAVNQFRSVITTPASQATQAVTYSLNTITNPTTTNTAFFVRIITYSDTGTTTIDEGTAAFATLTTTSIAVSASVLENFTFSIAGVSSGTVNGATINITTAAATIPFGTLAVATPNIGAHDVSVSTNAGSGYQVTVKAAADPPLASGSNNIDTFTGTYGTPTTWSSPNGTSASVNTGFFGYTTEDTDFSVFQSNKWAGSETTARAVVSNAVGTSSQTTRVGWQAEVNSIQPAGSSYTGTVILVATPTY